MGYLKEKEELEKLLRDIPKKIYDYMVNNLTSSLTSIGFSKEFVEYFVHNLKDFNFHEFYSKFGEELEKVYDVGFFQKLVPAYFIKEVVPNIPSSKKILDIGCGTGILIHTLAKNEKFKELIGIDIHKYSEWDKFKGSKVKFKIVKEAEFEDFINKTRPDNIILTWTLHHMDFGEQERYLAKIFDIIGKSSRLVILEDSYAEEILPVNGKNRYDLFMKLEPNERVQVMSVYDWFANRLLVRRKSVPIPFGYRTLEEWENLCKKIGYKVIEKFFIGFPDHRDINTPQSLLVVEK